MKRLFVAGVLLALGFCTSVGAQTQSGISQDLFRMERAQPGGAACVLVREDGSYRLEKALQAKTEMYTGALDPAGVGQLRALLANEQLRKLSQADIHNPLITDTFDNVQLAIWRGQNWQELLFVSPSSRKSFKESLDPLLRWFKDLQKRPPEAARVEGTLTRCKPTPTMQIAVHVEASESTRPTAAGSRAQYLFRLRSSHYYSARAESTCTIVFGDGSYHWEQSNQAFGANRQDRIVDGQLQAQSLHELQQILTASDLEKSTGNPEVKNLPIFQEGTITVLNVPRETQVQDLIFATVFNTKGGWLEIGGKNNLRYRITDQRLLEPLKKWMKDNSDAHEKKAERTVPGNDCTVVKSTAENNSN